MCDCLDEIAHNYKNFYHIMAYWDGGEYIKTEKLNSFRKTSNKWPLYCLESLPMEDIGMLS